MKKRIYFLGIGGTLMGSLAILAKEAGYEVSGSDGKIYPPMSTLLSAAKVEVHEGFKTTHLLPPPDTVVIGNANLPRGVESLEYVLNQKLHYESGAEWLGRNILPDRTVYAVAGTHGKTSTASMLAWIFEETGRSPGYLIGGAPLNFKSSARLGTGRQFIVEADEYDTSYFDRRAKFMHYPPDTLLINNIEFDHADIYADLASIQYQFHHLIRTVPATGRIVVPWGSTAMEEVLEKGCWSKLSYTSPQPIPRSSKVSHTSEFDLWYAEVLRQDGSEVAIFHNHELQGNLRWGLMGQHNVSNGLQAIAAAFEAGVPPLDALAALRTFKGIKRRMEVFAVKGSLTFYDDFAHHPTAITTTLQGLRDRVGTDKITAVIEPRTHTMQMGAHREALRSCCAAADEAIWFKSDQVSMDLKELAAQSSVRSVVFDDLDALVDEVCHTTDVARHVVLMSNGGFGNVYERIRRRLS